MNETDPEVARVERALLQADLGDLAVRARRDRDGQWRLVVYVVSTLPVAEQRARAVAAAAPSAIEVVPLATLPLADDGSIDEEALRRLPCFDEPFLCAWERALDARLAFEERPRPIVVGEVAEGADRSPEVERDDRPAGPGIRVGAPLTLPADLPATLGQLLAAAVARATPPLELVDAAGAPTQLPLVELATRARQVAAALVASGLQPGDAILVQPANDRDALVAFWGAVVGGFAPLLTAALPRDLDTPLGASAAERLRAVWRLLDGPPVIASASVAAPVARALPDAVVRPLETLAAAPAPAALATRDAASVAFYTLSSGSTGTPKVIPVTHAAALARAHAAIEHGRHRATDVTLSWLPLDHIGSLSDWHLRPLLLGCRQLLVATDWILKEPRRWLDLLSERGATQSWAPNFAFGLLSRALASGGEARWDLSRVTWLLSAGEAVSAELNRTLETQLGRYGLRRGVIRAAFGMAELASGVTYVTDEESTRELLLDRRALDVGDRVRRALPGGRDAVSIASVGGPIPGVAVRIVGAAGEPLSERTVGRVQVRGAPVFGGYHERGTIVRSAFDAEGWFDTGDLGLVDGGGLHLVGRAKETLIVNGVKFQTQELEELVARVGGLDPREVCVYPLREDDGSERIAVFVVLTAGATLSEVAPRVRTAVASALGMSVDAVVAVPAGSLRRTSIGKPQRADLARRYGRGELGDVDVDELPRRTAPPGTVAYALRWRRRAPRLQLELVGRRVAVVGSGATGAQLVDALLRRGCRATRLDPAAPAAAAFEDVIVRLDDVGDPFALLPALARALAGSSSRPRLFCVGARLFAAGEHDRPDPKSAAAIALARTLTREQRGIRLRAVDVGEAAIDEQGELLCAELADAAPVSSVAWRERVRLVARVVAAPASSRAGALREGGTYVVAGGLGRVGRTLVAALRARVRSARILVLGRTAPDRLTVPPDVVYRVVDVRDGDAVARVVRDALRGWGVERIDGVFHLAGSYRTCPLADEDAASIGSSVAVKLDGARSLWSLVAGDSRAFFVALSSLAWLRPASGVAAYAAANAALEAFCLGAGQGGARVRSVATGPWLLDGDDAAAGRWRSLGLVPAPADALLEWLLRDGAGGGPILLGLDADADAWRDEVDRSAPELLRPIAYTLGEIDPAACRRADVFGTPVVCEPRRISTPPQIEGSAAARRLTCARAPLSATETLLAALFREVLERSEVGRDDGFLALGGTSLQMARLLARIEERTGVSLPQGALFVDGTVAALARRIDAAEATSPRSVVKLGADRASPFFCVAGASGSVLELEPAARALGSSVTLHALYPADAGAAARSIEEMAAAYLLDVRRVQPRGPFLLGGYCGGGVVAWEMARLLEAAGEEVALLLLHTEFPRPDTRTRLARSLRAHALGVRNTGALSHARALVRRRRRTAANERPALYAGAWDAMAAALSHHRPSPFGGRVLLVAAEEMVARDIRHWAALAGGGVAVRRVGGDHLAMMRAPAASSWAVPVLNELQEHIGRSRHELR